MAAHLHSSSLCCIGRGLREAFKKQAFAKETDIAAKGHINIGKLGALAGETYSINEKGEIKAQPLRSTFLNDMLFSLRSYQEAMAVKHRTTKGDQWDRVLLALEVRHRITHPKDLAGLEITDDEVVNVGLTLHWFLGEVSAVFREKGYEIPDF